MKVKLAHGTAQLIKLKGSGWYLYSIIVDKNYRNRGIGTRIMQKIIRTCDPPIYLLATSELGSDGVRLVQFYERFGFTKVNQHFQNSLGYNYNMVRC